MSGVAQNGVGYARRGMRLLAPKLLSFDVFGTLANVRDGSYGAFTSILRDSGAADIDVKGFWEFWEERNIAHYWEPYRPYKEICEISLAEAFARFGINGRADLIGRYFDAFGSFELFPDVPGNAGDVGPALSPRDRLQYR